MRNLSFGKLQIDQTYGNDQTRKSIHTCWINFRAEVRESWTSWCVRNVNEEFFAHPPWIPLRILSVISFFKQPVTTISANSKSARVRKGAHGRSGSGVCWETDGLSEFVLGNCSVSSGMIVGSCSLLCGWCIISIYSSELDGVTGGVEADSSSNIWSNIWSRNYLVKFCISMDDNAAYHAYKRHLPYQQTTCSDRHLHPRILVNVSLDIALYGII